MKDVLFECVGIVGLGLIGGSIALSIKENKLANKIVGIDKDIAALDEGLNRGAIDQVGDLTALKHVNLCILAIPPHTTIQLAKQIAKNLNNYAILTDVASTKQKIVKMYEKLCGGNFIGGHPLSGKRTSGIKAADSKLFTGRICILTPTKITKVQTLSAVARLWEAIGAKVLQMTPQEHDRILAYTSHLPHLIAVVLTQLCKKFSPIYGQTFETFAEIANENPLLWAQIISQNKRYIKEAVETFKNNLNYWENLFDQKIK